MPLSLLLLPAVGGYWLLTHCNYTRYRAERYSGYHLLFRSALYGVALYFAARFITFLLDLSWPSLTMLWEAHVSVPFTSEVMLSLVLAFLFPIGFNIFYDSERGARRTAGEVGDHIELLIDSSMRNRRLIELSLRSRKTYVGYATETGIGRNTDTDVILVPLLSGHRDTETLRLSLETNYDPVIETYMKTASSPTRPDLRVVIPLSEIVTARLFELSLYRVFQQESEEL